MKKWEEKYANIKSGELNTRINELQDKLDKKTITREEYKELEKSKRIRENVPKIENILEYKAKLDMQLQELKDEESKRKALEESRKEEKFLESELKGLKLRKDAIENKLRGKNISDAERTTLQAELGNIKDKISKNQEAFSKNWEKRESAENSKGKLANTSTEEIIARKMNISAKISKCNMICGRLVAGDAWKLIDLKLEQWQDRKLTAKKGTANKLRDASEANKAEKSAGNDLKNKVNTGKELVEVTEFEQKHPRLAKIRNLFRKIGKSIKERFKSGNDEKEVDKKELNEKDEFRKYIKVVAEKGMRQADKDKLEAKRKELQQRIAESQGREPGDD